MLAIDFLLKTNRKKSIKELKKTLWKKPAVD